MRMPTALGQLRVGRNSAYEAARRGELPAVRIGRRLLVPRLALERLLSGDRGDADGQHHADMRPSAAKGARATTQG